MARCDTSHCSLMERTLQLVNAIFLGTALVSVTPALGRDVPSFEAGLRSVKIEATDFEKSAAFYLALGMTLGTKRAATWDLNWDQPTQNSGIVMTTPEYARRAEMVRGGTYLMVMTPNVAAVANKLRQIGYPDVPEPRQMGTLVTVMMLRDPDGNRIELMGPPAPEK